MTPQPRRQAPPSPPAEPEGPNPALVPEVEESGEREYEVVGPRTVHGHEPGSRFRALLTELQEAALVEGGHIRVVEAKPSDDDSTTTTTREG